MSKIASVVELAKAAGLEDLPQTLWMTVARRLIAAATSSSRERGIELSSQLQELSKLLWARLPEHARTVITNSSPDANGVRQAFSLGQLDFASAVAAQMTELRESDDFREALLGVRYSEYVRALAEGEKSGVDLAARVKNQEETVSRRLSELRELGITDFRRDGRLVINFLTPAARSVYERAQASRRATVGPDHPSTGDRSRSSSEQLQSTRSTSARGTEALKEVARPSNLAAPQALEPNPVTEKKQALDILRKGLPRELQDPAHVVTSPMGDVYA